MCPSDTQAKFRKVRGNGLYMEFATGSAWAFVDWQEKVVMVPVITQVSHSVVEEAIESFWPTINTILWPEGLDVEMVEARLAPQAILKDNGRSE